MASAVGNVQLDYADNSMVKLLAASAYVLMFTQEISESTEGITDA